MPLSSTPCLPGVVLPFGSGSDKGGGTLVHQDAQCESRFNPVYQQVLGLEFEAGWLRNVLCCH